MLYRAKPVAVEAWLWGGEEREQVPDWVLEATRLYPRPGGIAPFFEGDNSLRDFSEFYDRPHLAVVAVGGTVFRMAKGAWIIRGVDGTLSIVPPRVFLEMYEPAHAPATMTDEFTQSFDAMEWAIAFVARLGGWKTIDVELMHSWFANAMMRGWDERARRFQYRPSLYERVMTALGEKRRRQSNAGAVRLDQ